MSYTIWQRYSRKEKMKERKTEKEKDIYFVIWTYILLCIVYSNSRNSCGILIILVELGILPQNHLNIVGNMYCSIKVMEIQLRGY